MLKDAINWFEIPVTDFERAKAFYCAIFDFEMPETMMQNRMGFFLYDMEGSNIGGAIVQGEGYIPSKLGAKIYLNAGNDLNVVLNRIENAGGKIINPKSIITPELGYIALFEDTEGNHVFLHSMN